MLSPLIIEDMTGEALAEDFHLADEALKAKRLRYLRRLWSEAKRLVIPTYSPRPPKHWTLLVLQRGETGGEARVHYYDTLVKEHAGCKSNALRLLEALQVKVERVPLSEGT